jgi:hypothetical protein
VGKGAGLDLRFKIIEIGEDEVVKGRGRQNTKSIHKDD